ncbi:hypothetical protein SALBM217S_01851 [Streptomyces griseoloalbus]
MPAQNAPVHTAVSSSSGTWRNAGGVARSAPTIQRGGTPDRRGARSLAPRTPSSGRDPAVVQGVTQLDLTLISPLMIFSLAVSMAFWSSASAANFGLEFDRLTSPVLRSPLTIPVVGLPSSTDFARL